MSCSLFLACWAYTASAARPRRVVGMLALGAACLGTPLAQAQALRPGLWEFEGQHSQLRQSSGQTVDMQKINQHHSQFMPYTSRLTHQPFLRAGMKKMQCRGLSLLVKILMNLRLEKH